MIAQIQLRRGTTAEWAAAAPVILSAGEPGYDTTLKQLRIGDGDSEWNQLSPIGALECPYDVGDILTTINPASPAVRWPGTVWAAMAPGRVLVGVDPADPDFDAPGKTGGSKTHDHDYVHSAGISGDFGYVIDPKTLYTRPGAFASSNHARIYGNILKYGDSTNVEQYVSKTSSASVLPPYETVYRYKRTA